MKQQEDYNGAMQNPPGKFFSKLKAFSTTRDGLLLVWAGSMLFGIFLYQKLAGFPLSYNVSSEQWPATFFYFAILLPTTPFVLLYSVSSIQFNQESFRFYMATIVIFFLVIAGIAIVTSPTIAQDAYWNLVLGKAFSQHGLNPYTTTPNMLLEKNIAVFPSDSWSYFVRDWRDMTMVYGPIWPAVLFLVTAFSASIATSLFFLKIILFAVLGLIFVVLSKVMHHMEFPPQKILQTLLLLMWNPFIIQNVLVEAHNDMLMVLFMVLSLLGLLKKRYFLAVFFLVLGGLTKYVCFFLLPIPLWYIAREWRIISGKKKLAGDLVSLIFLSVIPCLIAYYPFSFYGIVAQSFGSMNNTVSNLMAMGKGYPVMPGALLFGLFLPLSWGMLTAFGAVAGLLVEILFVIRGKILQAYTLFFLPVFFFTPWFLSWYGLWILPIMVLYASPVIVTLITVMLLYNQIFSPILSIVVAAVVFFGTLPIVKTINVNCQK